MFWNGDYGFFSYKYDIADYHGQDYDGPARWFYLIFTLASIAILITVFALLRRKGEKYTKWVDIYLKVLAIVMPILEATKITWESINDISHGQGFNWCGLLPIYTCSLFIYSLIFAAFAKGKMKEWCLSWVAAIGLVGGMSNVLFIQGLKWYPFWTFGAFYSMFFHYIMVFTALLIVFTRYKKFEIKDFLGAMAIHCGFSLIVILIDYIFHWDYMQYYEAGGVPLIEDISSKFAEAGVRFLTVPLMIFLYALFAIIFISLYTLYGKTEKKIEQ